MLSRTEIAISNLNVEGLGLEIGPGYSPMTRGYPNVRYLDHGNRDFLINKYRDHKVDLSAVPEIDYVWAGEPYIKLVGDKRFDWILASHVVEHAPCLVTFLNQCSNILKACGILSLIVPDKRYCFDYLRPPTGLAPVLDTYLNATRKPTPGALAEATLNACSLDGVIMWPAGHSGSLELIHTVEQARDCMTSVRRMAISIRMFGRLHRTISG